MPLDGIENQFNPPAVEEAAQPIPAAQCMANGLGNTTSPTDLPKPQIEHAPKAVDDEVASFPPDGTTLMGRQTTYVDFNHIESREVAISDVQLAVCSK